MLDESQAIEAYIDTEKTEQFYKDAFSKYSATGVDQFQWHWSWWAMFGGVFYLLYRKLYLEALVYFILFAAVGAMPMISLLLWIAGGGILPYFIYKRYQKTKAQVEQNLSGTQEQLDALSTVGGVNQWAILVGVALHVIMWIGTIYMMIIMSAAQH